jgi:hypothetical protein
MDVIETRQTPKCAKMDNNYYGSEKDLRGNYADLLSKVLLDESWFKEFLW